ncbi:MAG: hypothetical protein ACPGTO_04230 [Polaribacter sp.]
MNYIEQSKIISKAYMILVILAAGLGSRYGGTKQLDIVGNISKN